MKTYFYFLFAVLFAPYCGHPEVITYEFTGSYRNHSGEQPVGTELSLTSISGHFSYDTELSGSEGSYPSPEGLDFLHFEITDLISSGPLNESFIAVGDDELWDPEYPESLDYFEYCSTSGSGDVEVFKILLAKDTGQVGTDVWSGTDLPISLTLNDFDHEYSQIIIASFSGYTARYTIDSLVLRTGELLEIAMTPDQKFRLHFGDILQESDDLIKWEDVNPQPNSPYLFTTSLSRKFYRLKP